MKNSILKKGLFVASFFVITGFTIYKKSNETSLSKKGVATNALVLNNKKVKALVTTVDPRKSWVDSIYNQMTLEEKVGQLFMISAYSNKGESHKRDIAELVEKYKVGGIIFFQGGPVKQAELTNYYQSKAKVPLFIGIDAEWGLNMRLDSTYAYPWNMTLGAIQDLKLIEEVGKNMGEECKRIGVNFNFGPVLDINTNPLNPIIGNRSYGENKANVANKSIAMLKGVQSQGVLSTGKHFPGHGDTASDSHKTLPSVDFSRERIEDVELYPYRKIFKEGLESVMVAHLNIPSLESEPNVPTSASYNVVTNLLQKQMHFKGLIFTDGLGMKGAADYKANGDLEVAVILAGNDILLFPTNVPVAFEKLIEACNSGQITEERLAHSVRKILQYKYKVGYNKYQPIDLQNIVSDLNAPKKDALQYKLYENAVTVLKNDHSILPISNVNQKIAYVQMGDDVNSAFISTLKKYTDVTEVTASTIDDLIAQLKEYQTVIVGLHKKNTAWAAYNFSSEELLWLQKIAENNKVILDVFTKPYALLPISDFTNIEGVVVSYQNSDISQIVSAEIIFGAVGAKGKLPVSINTNFPVNAGLITKKINRLGFANPENVGMSSATLSAIDQIAQKAIDGRMAPGMQVLVARNGKVVFQKSYGYQTYDKVEKITDTNLYDVASLSKIISTLPNVMQAYDQKKVTLDSKLGTMVPFLANTNKKDITFKELLSHYAGLEAWKPFYKQTLNSLGYPSEEYYRKKYDLQFSRKVADSLYVRSDYHDTIMKIIADSPLATKKVYKYSDYTFMILKEYLEASTHERLEVLSQRNFFAPIGMTHTLYNPLYKFKKENIAPTEVDTYYRHQTIQGYVHDQGAAIEGGVQGHAGVFSNAMDVAKMMQLFLQKGNYGGTRYFSEATFNTFNTCHFCSKDVHRGLGFDKRLEKNGPTCGCTSPSSFGHTGFTGDIAWVDPEKNLVYIFLSNRTFPEVTNEGNKLAKNNIREDIQQIIYDAIIE